MSLSKESSPLPISFLVGTTGQTGRLIVDEFDKKACDAHLCVGARSHYEMARVRV